MINKNLVGKNFGYLTVLDQCGTRGGRKVWTCKCTCGSVVDVDTHSLTSGNTKSCGCKKYGGRLSHGEAKAPTRLYRIWAAMKKRCDNEGSSNFYLYGGKGINVCGEWQHFEQFRDWAIANGYKENLTIDRINSDGDYEPQNCRWTTYKVQSNNTSRNHYVTAFGETMTISQWSDRFGVRDSTIAARLNILGWNAEDSVSIPVRCVRHET